MNIENQALSPLGGPDRKDLRPLAVNERENRKLVCGVPGETRPIPVNCGTAFVGILRQSGTQGRKRRESSRHGLRRHGLPGAHVARVFLLRKERFAEVAATVAIHENCFDTAGTRIGYRQHFLDSLRVANSGISTGSCNLAPAGHCVQDGLIRFHPQRFAREPDR